MAGTEFVTTQSVAGKSIGRWILTILKWTAIAILCAFAWLVLFIVMLLFMLSPAGKLLSALVSLVGLGLTMRGLMHMKNAAEDPDPIYGRGIKFCLIGLSLVIAEVLAVHVSITSDPGMIYIEAPAASHQQP